MYYVMENNANSFSYSSFYRNVADSVYTASHLS